MFSYLGKYDWVYSLYIQSLIKYKMIEILVFTKQGCPPCEQLKKELKDKENIVYLDAIENMAEYNLRQAPTTVIKINGKERERFTGFKAKSEIEELIKRVN